MAFDSKDTAAFKGVWVFCEQREGVIMSTSYQLLSEGRKLANDLGVELCGVVLGKDVKEEYLKALGGYGADKVYYCNHELLDLHQGHLRPGGGQEARDLPHRRHQHRP